MREPSRLVYCARALLLLPDDGLQKRTRFLHNPLQQVIRRRRARSGGFNGRAQCIGQAHGHCSNLRNDALGGTHWPQLLHASANMLPSLDAHPAYELKLLFA